MRAIAEVWWTVALLAVGCGELPPPELIEHARPLAIVAEASEPQSSQAVAFEPYNPGVPTPNTFLPGDQGRLLALLADGSGVIDPQRVESRWLACLRAPQELPLDCFREGLRQDASPRPCAGFDRDGPGAVCDPEFGADGSFSFPLLEPLMGGRSMAVALFAGVDRGVQGCLDAFAGPGYELPDDCLYTTHELPLATVSEPRGRNPAIREVRARIVREGQRGELMPLELGGVIDVAADERLEIEVSFFDDAAQIYPEVIFGRDEVEEVSETIVTSWFATGGEFDRIVSRGLEIAVEWEAGEEGIEGGEEVRVFAVARDGRFGGGWFQLGVRLVE